MRIAFHQFWMTCLTIVVAIATSGCEMVSNVETSAFDCNPLKPCAEGYFCHGKANVCLPEDGEIKATDQDSDGVQNDQDNCPYEANPSQEDRDEDGLGNACDKDDDGDGILDKDDNCPLTENPDQENNDGDSEGDACDTDDDNDTAVDEVDNCPMVANDDQLDNDGDEEGDACDTDDDNDTILDEDDNCPLTENTIQLDTDGDEEGDACDLNDDGDIILDESDNCPLIQNDDQLDTDDDAKGNACDNDDDGDGVEDDSDNCQLIENPNQENADKDEDGDACDVDDDDDTILDAEDNCSLVANEAQEDADNDGIGDVCDGDTDGDEVDNDADNCPEAANNDQADLDDDGQGDACDTDDDGDGIADSDDNCPAVANENQVDLDGDKEGNACDLDDDGDEVEDDADNCPLEANTEQTNSDQDDAGDACDSDDDGDAITDEEDNCPLTANADQNDTDGDDDGDACDLDDDGDTVTDEADNCPWISNQDQLDTDEDLEGDVCDLDDDGDGIIDENDNCPLLMNPGQDNLDDDEFGDTCDGDIDGDGIQNADDNCPMSYDVDAQDTDDDGFGDLCDDDDDNDGLEDPDDNCPKLATDDVSDTDDDGEGDACDPDDDNDGVLDADDTCPLAANPDQIPLAEDANNCGFCGKVCAELEPNGTVWACIDGFCEIEACKPGYKDIELSFGCEAIPTLFVDAAKGDDSLDGQSPQTALKTMQAAVDLAEPNTEIHLNGIFDGSVSIDKASLTLIGQGPDKTYLTASPTQVGIRIDASDVVLKNLAIIGGVQGVAFTTGAWKGGLENVSISGQKGDSGCLNCEIAETAGLMIVSAAFLTIRDVHIANVQGWIQKDGNYGVAHGINVRQSNNLVFEDILIEKVEGVPGGATVYKGTAPAYGIHLAQSSANRFERVVIRGIQGGQGQYPSYGGSVGTGLYTYDASTTDYLGITISNIRGGNAHSSIAGTAAEARAIYSAVESASTYRNVLIYDVQGGIKPGNDLPSLGYGLFLSHASNVTFDSFTVADIETGYGFWSNASTVSIANWIFSNVDFGVWVKNKSVTVNYSLFHQIGNKPLSPYAEEGEGVIFEEDPLFAGDTFLLEPDSPAVDAGDPESEYCAEPQANGGRINMGAYGNTPAASAHPDAIEGVYCGD